MGTGGEHRALSQARVPVPTLAPHGEMFLQPSAGRQPGTSQAMSAVVSPDRPSHPSASQSITVVRYDFSSIKSGGLGDRIPSPVQIIFEVSEMARKICATDVKGKRVLGSFPQRERSS